MLVAVMLYSMRPSLSSEFFLRPQTLKTTKPRAPSAMAPPTPATTPMTIFRVFGVIPEDSVEPSAFRAGVGVDVIFDVVVTSIVDPSLLVVDMTMILVVTSSC